jgi:hypothetical protein
MKSFISTRLAVITPKMLCCDFRLKEGVILLALRRNDFILDSNGVPLGSFTEKITDDGGIEFKQKYVRLEH